MKYVKYSEQGIAVFACFQNKTPATATGFYAATADSEKLKTQFASEDMLIGLPTGNVTGIVVIDLDLKGGWSIDDLFEKLKEYGEIPDTFQVETPSGGRHLYFAVAETNLTSSVRFFNKNLPIDIRANGGYVCAPDGDKYIVFDDVDDLGIDNLKARCALLPVWIESYKKPLASENLPAPVLPPSEIREIRSALNFIDADDRDAWIRVGMALKATGDPAAQGLWNEYSQKSEKYNPIDQTKRWETLKPRGDITIASLFHEAQQSGWVTTYEKKLEIIPPEELEKTITQKKKEPFPEDLIYPKGLVGDITRYIVDTAIRPQPTFALAAALCAVGALAGRKFQTQTLIRTNIYCLCVGNSGSGKEAPRRALKNLFTSAGCPQYARTEDVASDSAIITELQENPSQIFLLDEIGRFLKTTLNAGQNSHLYNVVSVLMRLYSSPDAETSGKIYADAKNKKSVSQANLCLYGTTVPEVLYRGMNVEHITDGFLSRMFIFETDDQRPRKRRNLDLTKPPPVEIIDQIKALDAIKINTNPQGNLDGLNARARIVEIAEEARDMLYEFDDVIDDMRDDLEKDNKIEVIYNRTSQIAEQIALIVAIGRNIDNPIIDEDCMTYAIRLAKHLSDRMQYIVTNYIATNDYERELKNIYQIIATKGKMSKYEIALATQYLQSYYRDDILSGLLEMRRIIEWKDTNTGTIFYASR